MGESSRSTVTWRILIVQLGSLVVVVDISRRRIDIVFGLWWFPLWVCLLSQSLDNLGITRGECLERTRWSSPLDWTTYLYYFYKWLYATNPRSHVLLECSIVTWPCHMIWLLMFPHYLYLVFIVWLDICDQVFERVGNLFLLEAFITWPPLQDSSSWGIFPSIPILVSFLFSFFFVSFSLLSV